MTSLFRRLRSSSPSPLRTGGKSDLVGADMFLVQVIAFGEVFAVPVCRTTPVTVVLRHVMEAAVTEEQAAELGSVGATLYYKDKPLQLDGTMATVSRSAVLHLHSSVSITSSIIRNCRNGAVSMLPGSRRRHAHTTATMQPCLRGKSVVSGGCGDLGSLTPHRLSSGFAGLSSECSPNTERQESPAGAGLGSICESVSSAYPNMGLMSTPMLPEAAPVKMWPPAVLPMMSAVPVATAAGTGIVSETPCYYFVPCAGAAAQTSIRLLSTQSRSASGLSLMASRRRDSAVEFANNYRFVPVGVSPLHTAATTAVDLLSSSPLPSPPNVSAVAASRFPDSSDPYLVLYLRLPRDRAVACMSAAALNTDRSVVVDAVEADEVPVEALLNSTMSTVVAAKSCATRAYTYRRLRVLRDFPVGTLRELFAVAAEHRLHLAHAEVEDEQKTFREMNVAPNAVFYFKRRAEAEHQHSLTRERIREHLGAAATALQSLEMTKDDSSAERHSVLSCIEPGCPSADLSFPQATVPMFSGTVPSVGAHNCSQNILSSSATFDALSIKERIQAFNENAVHSFTYGAEQAICSADGGAAEHLQSWQKQQRTTERDESPVATPLREIVGVESEESCIDVDCCLSDEEEEEATTTMTIATRRAPSPQAGSASQVTSTFCFATPPVDAAKQNVEADALHGEVVVVVEAARTTASTQLPKTRRASMLVTKLDDLCEDWTNGTSVSTALAPPRRAAEGARSLSVADALQPAVDAGEPLNPLSAHVNGGFLRPLHSTDEATDAAPRRGSLRESNKEAVTAKRGVQSPEGTPAVSRPTSTESPSAKTKRSNSASFFHPLRWLLSRQHKPRSATRSSSFGKDASAAAPLAAASSLTPSISEEVLKALRRKSENFSSKKKSKETAGTTSTRTTALAPLSAEVAVRTTGAVATTESAERGKVEMGYTAVQPQAIPGHGRPSRGSGSSYSQRTRRASASMPCQPVAFLGSDSREAANITLPTATLHAAEDISTTVEPAVLSSTHIPTPHESQTPVSILVSATQGQRSSWQSKNRSPGSCSFERVNPTASLRQRRAESGTPEYSVESPSSAHGLRIILKDPKDPTRFHYGIPVEPDCPVGELREWIAAMQRPSSAAGEVTPNLRDAQRYGIFLGDTYLPQADSATFAEVTRGRNDTVFSIRSL
ncbi:hypothetical protein MNV84_03466 [Leishmania braziliensis]|nr:hypothetical protein MNV84_03466 [Leishmania braziliensis]